MPVSSNTWSKQEEKYWTIHPFTYNNRLFYGHEMKILLNQLSVTNQISQQSRQFHRLIASCSAALARDILSLSRSLPLTARGNTWLPLATHSSWTISIYVAISHTTSRSMFSRGNRNLTKILSSQLRSSGWCRKTRALTYSQAALTRKQEQYMCSRSETLRIVTLRS